VTPVSPLLATKSSMTPVVLTLDGNLIVFKMSYAADVSSGIIKISVSLLRFR